ncbi:MAG: hypothetical protein JW874_01085, partial [Spirochaetales bacterium]|nr:hypothetical protein [Spirochaetales bacterium]
MTPESDTDGDGEKDKEDPSALPEWDSGDNVATDDTDSRWYWMRDLKEYIKKTDCNYSGGSIQNRLKKMFETWGMAYAYIHIYLDQDMDFPENYLNGVLGFPKAIPLVYEEVPNGYGGYNTVSRRKNLAEYKEDFRLLGLEAYNTLFGAGGNKEEQKLFYYFFEECYEHEDSDNSDENLINPNYTCFENNWVTGGRNVVDDALRMASERVINDYFVEYKADRRQRIRDLRKEIDHWNKHPILYAAAIIDAKCKINKCWDTIHAIEGAMAKLAYEANEKAYNDSMSFIAGSILDSNKAISKYYKELATLNEMKGVGDDEAVTLQAAADSIQMAYEVTGREGDLAGMIAMLGKGDVYGIADFLKDCYADMKGLNILDKAALTAGSVLTSRGMDDLIDDLANDCSRTYQAADELKDDILADLGDAYLDAYSDYREVSGDYINGEDISRETLKDLARGFFLDNMYNPQQVLLLEYRLFDELAQIISLENNNEANVLQMLCSARNEALCVMMADKNANYSEVQEARISLLEYDMYRQAEQYNQAVETIYWRGQEEWDGAEEKMDESFETWQEDFGKEYEDKSLLWTEEYYALVTEKELWVNEATVKASQIGSAKVLSDLGMSVDLATAGFETYTIDPVSLVPEDFTVRLDEYYNRDVMQALLDAVTIQSAGLDTIQTRIFASMRYDSGSEVLQKIREYQTQDRSEIEYHTALLMADQAVETLAEAENALRDQIKLANFSFDAQMDAIFCNAGFVEISDTEYQLTYVESDTLFGGTEWATVTVDQFQEYVYDGDLCYPQPVCREMFTGLSANGIQAQIDTVITYYNAKREEIFGDGDVDEEATRARMDAYAASLEGLNVKKNDDGDWIFLRPDTEAEDSYTLTANGNTISFDDAYDSDTYQDTIENYICEINGIDPDTLGDDFNEDIEDNSDFKDRLTKILKQLFLDEDDHGDNGISGMMLYGGKFNEWIGYAPVFYADAKSGGGDENVLMDGAGQLDTLLKAFQEGMLLYGEGMAEYKAPFYNKRMWDAEHAPTLRTVIDMALDISLLLITGGNSLLLTSVIGLVDDAMFTMMDVSGGMMEWDDALKGFGQKALTSVATGAIGQYGKFAKTLGGSIAKSMATAGAANVINGALNSWDEDGNFNFGDFAESVFGKDAMTGYVTGIVTATASFKLGEYDWGLNDGNAFAALLTTNQRQGLTNMISAFCGQVTNFLFTGEITFNILNISDIGRLLGMENDNNLSYGLLELHIDAKDGTYLALGSGGASVSFFDFIDSVAAIGQMSKINELKESDAGKAILRQALYYATLEGTKEQQEAARKQAQRLIDNGKEMIEANAKGVEEYNADIQSSEISDIIQSSEKENRILFNLTEDQKKVHEEMNKDVLEIIENGKQTGKDKDEIRKDIEAYIKTRLTDENIDIAAAEKFMQEYSNTPISIYDYEKELAKCFDKDGNFNKEAFEVLIMGIQKVIDMKNVFETAKIDDAQDWNGNRKKFEKALADGKLNIEAFVEGVEMLIAAGVVEDSPYLRIGDIDAMKNMEYRDAAELFLLGTEGKAYTKILTDGEYAYVYGTENLGTEENPEYEVWKYKISDEKKVKNWNSETGMYEINESMLEKVGLSTDKYAGTRNIRTVFGTYQKTVESNFTIDEVRRSVYGADVVNEYQRQLSEKRKEVLAGIFQPGNSVIDIFNGLMGGLQSLGPLYSGLQAAEAEGSYRIYQNIMREGIVNLDAFTFCTWGGAVGTIFRSGVNKYSEMTSFGQSLYNNIRDLNAESFTFFNTNENIFQPTAEFAALWALYGGNSFAAMPSINGEHLHFSFYEGLSYNSDGKVSDFYYFNIGENNGREINMSGAWGMIADPDGFSEYYLKV